MRRLAMLVGFALLLIFAPAALAMQTSPDSTAESTPDGSARCLLTAREGYANVRQRPTTAANVVTRISTTDQAVGIAKLRDGAGTLWYFTPSGWTADVAVTASEGCDRLFTIRSFAEARRESAEIQFSDAPGPGQADNYVRQVPIYGNIPRTPAFSLNGVSISRSAGVVCTGADCGNLTVFVYLPASGRVTGFFSSTPEPGNTPTPPSLDTLLYTSPAECLPTGRVCLVAIARGPSAESASDCSAESLDALVIAAPVTHPDMGAQNNPATPLALLVQDLREAVVQSAGSGGTSPVGLPPLGQTAACEFDLMFPSNAPGEARFTGIDGGIRANFFTIRVTPPQPSGS